MIRTFAAAAGALLALVAFSLPASAQATFESSAPFALLMDYESGTVLYQKNADDPMEPASMAKLMTVAVVLDLIRDGAISLDDEFLISENAWRTGGAASGGSTMFAELNSLVSVDDLLHSVIIQSGNDASIALAEGIAGSEATFAAMMNELSREIGLDASHWTNASGLPDPEMLTTARDLAELGRYLIAEFPDYYPVFAIEEMTWNGIRQSNRNGLLGMGLSVDGLKTGHTNASGYGMVASTTEGGRRLIAVIHGTGSMAERTEQTRQLLTWGARSFERIPVWPEGATVGHARIYGGALAEVPLIGRGSIDIYVPRGSRRCLSAQIRYETPIMPPVAAGERLAELEVLCDDRLIQTAPLYAAQDVGEGDLTRRATDALWELAFGWF